MNDRANASNAGRSACARAASVTDLTNQVWPSPGVTIAPSMTLPSFPSMARIATSVVPDLEIDSSEPSAGSSTGSSPICPRQRFTFARLPPTAPGKAATVTSAPPASKVASRIGWSDATLRHSGGTVHATVPVERRGSSGLAPANGADPSAADAAAPEPASDATFGTR